ncbi:MAG: HD domain-containing protein [Anaerolineae bacterium]|nr:HD domain-containing protein [Anaerolineae bacterium]
MITDRNLLREIVAFIKGKHPEAYLVGGCVRDRLMGRESRDFDFVVASGAIPLGREIAHRFQGAFVLLDERREFSRVVFRDFYVDLARMVGKDLLEDLSHRDFTINAIAVRLEDWDKEPLPIIDPYGGKRDLELGVIRRLSPLSFPEDPCRVLRAVRFAAQLRFEIEPETLKEMAEYAPRLFLVSWERLRDELVLILTESDSFRYIKLMDELGILKELIPELEKLRGLYQSHPHHLDGFRHTLETLFRLEWLLEELKNPRAEGPSLAVAVGLGGMRESIQRHLERHISGDRKALVALKLATLFHDLGKPFTMTVDERGTHFYGHEREGALIAVSIMERFRFSSKEADGVYKIVDNHMRPALLAQEGSLSRKAIHRFWRDTKEWGVETCLLSLADHLATWMEDLIPERWEGRVKVVEELLRAYFNHYGEIFPPPLVRGNELIEALDLKPGPLVGKLLRIIEEAQVEGEVKTREEAIELARKILESGRG